MKTIVTDGVFKTPILDSGGVLLALGRQYVSESLALLVRQP